MQRLRHPIRAIREPFGKAGLTVAVVALVFAMVGGAFAAAGLNGKQKKEVKTIAKSFQGTGPAGAAGANGTSGTNGKDGTNGTDGAPGTDGEDGAPGANGKTVLSGTATPGAGTGTDGDFYIETDVNKIYGPKAAGAWPAGVDLKGPEGSPWTAGGTLPAGETETGTWLVNAPGIAALSFPIPLGTAIAEANVHYVTTPTAECEGSFAEPKADPGHLCAYVIGSGSTVYEAEFGFPMSLTSGAVLLFEGSGTAFGTFAVTG